MKNVGQIVFISVFLLSSFVLQGQEDPVSKIWNEIDSLALHTSDRQTVSSGPVQHWYFNTTLGTSFTYAPYLGSAMSLFAAPHVEYRTTDRLSFHGGMMVSHAIPMIYTENPEYPLSYGINNVAGYLSATYRLTDNLYVHGTGVQGIAVFPSSSDQASFLRYNDLSVGATYKIGSFSIGASIHRSNSPYMGLPYGIGHNRFSSPYYW